VDDTRNVTQNGEQDVDEEISVASSLEKDTERREDDGEDDFADIGCGERHVDGVERCLRLNRLKCRASVVHWNYCVVGRGRKDCDARGRYKSRHRT